MSGNWVIFVTVSHEVREGHSSQQREAKKDGEKNGRETLAVMVKRI
jgi:hypothetical protein